MKEIDKRHICYYCLGCVAEEQNNFTPRQRCKGFVPRISKLGKNVEKGAKEKWQHINLK